MASSSSTAWLQTPAEQRQVHYVSDNVFSLGTLSCAVCGQAFPVYTNVWHRSTCSCCGTLHEPGSYSAFQRKASGGAQTTKTTNKVCSLNTSAALFFTAKEIQQGMRHIDDTLGDELAGAGSSSGAIKKRAGQTEVDNRVIEDAFCETCGVHRPCKTFARQTRSADEGQTIFFQCTKCGSEWQQNS